MKRPFRKAKGGGLQIRYIPVPMGAETSSDPKKIQERLEELIQESNTLPDKPHNAEKIMDESRKTIAYWFVISFILIVGIVLLFIPIYNAIVFHNARVVVEQASYQPLDMAQVLTTIGTLLGAPLGFVVGYYFKEEHSVRNHGQDRNQK